MIMLRARLSAFTAASGDRALAACLQSESDDYSRALDECTAYSLLQLTMKQRLQLGCQVRE
jgi:hypothetical protein